MAELTQLETKLTEAIGLAALNLAAREDPNETEA